MTNEVLLSRSGALGGFDMLESQVHDFEYAAHRHPEVVIASYVAGFKIATCGQHQFVVNAGDVLVIGPETLHKAKTFADHGWHYRSAYLMPDQISASTSLSLSEVGRHVDGHRLHRRAGALGLKFSQALEDLDHQPLALAEFLTELLANTNALDIKLGTVSASLLRRRQIGRRGLFTDR